MKILINSISFDNYEYISLESKDKQYVQGKAIVNYSVINDDLRIDGQIDLDESIDALTVKEIRQMIIHMVKNG